MLPTKQAKSTKVDCLPSGISVIQAKKDAKSLAKSTGISRAEALDQVAFLHGRSKWATLMEQLSKQSVLTYRFNGKYLTIPEKKEVTLIVGQSGSGKSSLLAEMASQLLSNGHKVLILTQERIGLSHRNCTIMSVDDKDFDLPSLRVDGAVVLIDDIERLHACGIVHTDVAQFFHCIKHLVVTSDDMYDFRYFMGNLGIMMRILHLQNFAIRDRDASLLNAYLGQYPSLIEAIAELRKDYSTCEFVKFDGGNTREVYSFNNRQMNVSGSEKQG